MRHLATRLLLGLALTGLAALPLRAEGNLAKRAERLEALTLSAADGFNIKKYALETGKFYRWRIVSDGRDEYKLLAPELMRNSWVEQVSIEDKEVKPLGGLYAVEFDDEGEIDIYFLPVRPGAYAFYVEGYRNSGMEGVFEVK